MKILESNVTPVESSSERDEEAPPARRNRKSVFVSANRKPHTLTDSDGAMQRNDILPGKGFIEGNTGEANPADLSGPSPFVGTGLRRDLRDLPSFPAFHWDNIDVCHWLLDKNFAALVDPFYRGQVVGSTLLQMTAFELASLGIASTTHQQAILALRDTLISNAPNNGWTFESACSFWEKYRPYHVLGVAAESARMTIEQRLVRLGQLLAVALVFGSMFSAIALVGRKFVILNLLALISTLVASEAHFTAAHGGYREQLDFFEAVLERRQQLFKATVQAVSLREISVHEFSVTLRESFLELDRVASSGRVGDFYETAVHNKIQEEEALGGSFRSTYVDTLPEKKGHRLLILNEVSDGTLFRAFPDNPIAKRRREKHQQERV